METVVNIILGASLMLNLVLFFLLKEDNNSPSPYDDLISNIDWLSKDVPQEEQPKNVIRFEGRRASSGRTLW